MATTKSTKAKLRGKVSPWFGLEEAEKNVITRRHSLPSSIKGKLSSSPRAQKLVQASDKDAKKKVADMDADMASKGGCTCKTEAASLGLNARLCLSISEVVIQAEWRR
ncbi:unnamed protein product [Ilex paraguariensis]|uniref:DUF4005 domain-containing protein n=1 Tax=Ilex paraguariensis TaxID=185542 RepID=A0ABC8TSN7_9AQUA